jgi:enoyl-[acyl-carrier protein] reductase II
MFYTKVCKILNIQYPIILGGMVWVGKARLVAAVSEAGGLGLLGAGSMTVQDITSETNEIKALTNKPFGVNIPLVRPDAVEIIDAALKCGASVISTSSGNPKVFTPMIHDSGAKVIHVVSSVKFAEKCEQAGVDIIVAEGFEAGGHNGFDEITTMTLTPQVVDAVKTPVVSAGGIADGRGFIAALAMGAQGIQMGTRFMATLESAAHDNVKNAIIQMSDEGTCVTGRTTVGPTRCLKNNITVCIASAEQKGSSPEELNELIGAGRSMTGFIDGDCDEGSIYCGQIGGAIKQLKSAKDVISDIISEAQAVLNRITKVNQ